MHYAINLADLTLLQQKAKFGDADALLFMLLIEPCMSKQVITVSCDARRIDNAAMILDCTEERGEAIAQVVTHKRGRAAAPRIYRAKQAAWYRI